MQTVQKGPRTRLLLLPLALAALAGCQDGELPTGTASALGAPRSSLVLPATSPGTIIAWGLDADTEVTPTGSDFVAVADGSNYRVALRSDGTLVSWGDDSFNQVSHTPAGSDFVAVSTKHYHSVALRSDGSLVSWGNDEGNQVSHSPAGGDYVAVSAGYTHSVALRSDGTLVSWGEDQIGETPAGSDFTAVTAGGGHSLALRSNGSLVSWGNDNVDQVSGTPTGTDFVAVSAGGDHSVALRANGTLASWGHDFYGQVSDTPAGSDFVGVLAGSTHSVALRANGTLASWGHDYYGQVSDTPAESDFVAVAAGFQHSVAIRAAPSCKGVQIRMTRTSGPDAVAPGASGVWTVELEVSACEPVSEVSAQGGTVGWATTSAATSDGTIGVRKANKNNQVLLWEIGAMAAGDVATAVLTVDGTVGRKVACGTRLSIASDWSAAAGGAPVQYGAAAPLTIHVCDPPPPAAAAPSAEDDAYSLAAGETLNVLAPAGLLANDALGSPAATITAVLGADGEPLGDRTILEGVVAVDPATGAVTLTGATRAGTESFQYDITNAEGTSRAAVTITVDPGAAALMLAYAGENQFAAPGATLLVAPAVRVTDAWDNVIAAASVTFAVTGGGGSATGLSATTTSEGIATVGSWTLGPDAGVNTLEATSTGLASELFTATGITSCTGGTPETAVFSAFSDPVRNTLELTDTRDVTLLITDGCGTPAPGVEVIWAATGDPFNSRDAITGGAMTGADGKATAAWTYHYTCGTRTVSATVAGLPAVQHTLPTFGSCGGGGVIIRR